MSWFEIHKLFQNLSESNKLNILKSTIVYPNTESIKKDVEKSDSLKVTVDYECNDVNCNFLSAITKIKNDPKFKQIGSQDILVDITLNIQQNQQEYDVKSLDYFIIQRTKNPVVCFRNITTADHKLYSGVSGFLEINDMRAKLYSRYEFLDQRNYIDDIAKISLITGVCFIIGTTISNYFKEKK